MNTIRRSLCVAISSVVIGLFAAQATAQQPPAAPATAPAAKSTAVTAPVTKSAPATSTATAQPKATKAPAAKAKSKTAASVCKGLEQKACATKSECGWIAATKRKDGKQVKAYCRTKPATKKG